MLGGDGEWSASRGGFGTGSERLGGGASPDGSVGTGGVVVVGEVVELCLQVVGGAGGGLFLEPLLEGLVEAFDLAAGLGVIGPGVFGFDAQGEEFEFEH